MSLNPVRLQLSAATWITLGMLALGGVIWNIRLEGRVTLHDDSIARAERAHEQALAEVRAELRYIRERVDRAIEAER